MSAQDSYFGQTGHSFYGGPNGQSFSIKKIFSNKVALDNDLSNGLTSNIGPGDYVIINYYYPNYNFDRYEVNATTDENKYHDGRVYNATLWQKQTDTTAVNGLKYELIADFKTVTPGLKLTTDLQEPGSYQPYDEETKNYIKEDDDSTPALRHYLLAIAKPWEIAKGSVLSIDPAEDPDVFINYEDPDSQSETDSTTTRYVHFKLPKPWDISILKGDNTRPIDGPSISFIEDPSDTTTKSWQIQLPDAWKIMLGEDSGYCDPGDLENLTISINGSKTLPNSEAEGTTTKYIHFQIPNAWKLEGGTITPTNPGAEDNFSVSTSTEDPISGETSTDTQYINLSLPKPWQFDVGTFASNVSSTDKPAIAINHKKYNNSSVSESDEYYYFHFSIPPTQKFDDTQYGSAFTFSLLGSAGTQFTQTSFNLYDTNKEYPKVTVGLPLPTINSSYIDPYYQDVSDNKFKNKNPTIASSTSDWTINVELVKSPDFTLDLSTVPSNAPFSFNTQYSNAGIAWTAKIPKGTRIIYSDSEPSQQDIADKNIMSGDFYIDKNGDLYEYSTTYATTWENKISLRGNGFSIRADISINKNQLGEETNISLYQKFGTYVETNYPDLVSSLKTNEVLNILYHPNNDDDTEYHWLYKLAGGNNWSGSQVTGSVSNTFIKNDWQQSDSSQETYSITRINELRNQVKTNTTNIDSITTKSFNLTILQSNWNYTMPGYYTNIVTLNPSSETLHCGVDNKVPPLIYHGSTAINLYNLLDAVQVSDNRKSLTFSVKESDYANINADIPVIVIDHR